QLTRNFPSAFSSIYSPSPAQTSRPLDRLFLAEGRLLAHLWVHPPDNGEHIGCTTHPIHHRLQACTAAREATTGYSSSSQIHAPLNQGTSGCFGAAHFSLSQVRAPPALPQEMDLTYVHKAWEKWASTNVGTSGEPLKAALLVNYDPSGPSRLLSTIAAQEGTSMSPIEISQCINFVKRNKLQTETFLIGPNEYLVTSIHENVFHARSMNTSLASGEGVIVAQTSMFLLVAQYKGSLGSASNAIASVDQFTHLLGRKNL
ncbi:hypothetical protein V2J09_018381, partial [Rumex salicifolius]